MVSVHVSSVLDSGFKLWSGRTKDYKFGIFCFSTKHVAIRSKSIATVSNATFGDEDEHSPETEIRSGENEVSWYNFANFLSSVIR